MSRNLDNNTNHNAHRITGTIKVEPSLLKPEWTKCPRCEVELKSNNLEHHLDHTHHLKMSTKKNGRRLFLLIIGLLVVIAIAIPSGLFFLSTLNEAEDETIEDEPFNESWIDDYSPKMDEGLTENDWWIYNPNQNPDWGELTEHPTWVTDRLHDGPVLILSHSEGCMPCIEQQEDIDIIMKNYGSDLQFLDLLSGSDPESTEAHQSYDPDGSPSYIPLTVIVTLIEDSTGEVRIGWHSIEGASGEQWLNIYVKDAIYYHQENVDEWS